MNGGGSVRSMSSAQKPIVFPLIVVMAYCISKEMNFRVLKQKQHTTKNIAYSIGHQVKAYLVNRKKAYNS